MTTREQTTNGAFRELGYSRLNSSWFTSLMSERTMMTTLPSSQFYINSLISLVVELPSPSQGVSGFL